MTEITKEDKIEINRILESVKGRIDQKLCKLIMDLIFQNKVGIKKEDERLFSTNQKRLFHLVVFLAKPTKLDWIWQKKWSLNLMPIKKEY